MGYELEETGELSRKAIVKVPKEEFEGEIDDRLRELSEEVDLDGFRQGNVPLSVMRQRYGQQVTQEVVEELVNDNINDLIEDLGNVLHLGRPEVESVPMQEDDELVFTVDLELRPEVDPVGYLGLEVDKPTVEVDSEDIDQELEGLREQHAETQPVSLREEIREGDIVTLDFEALDDRPELEQMQGDDVEIEVGSGQALPGIDDALEGQDLDATVESEIELGDDFPVQDLQGEQVEVRLNVKQVQTKSLPELNDDFALKTGEGETLLELRGNIRERLEEAKDEEARRVAEQNLVDKLLEQNDFELPPNFVDQQLENTAEQRLQMLQQQGLDPSDLDLDVDAFKEQMRDQVVRQIKTEFLIIDIAQKENIEVEEEDMRDYFEGQAEQMGINMQQYMAFMRQNEDMMRQANATVLLDKTKSHLLDEAEINEVDWSEIEQDRPGAGGAGVQEVAEQDEEADEAEEDDEQ